MRDYLYPECPICKTKASEGEGLKLFEVSYPPFVWTCPDCKRRFKGGFWPSRARIEWINERPPSIWNWVKELFGRFFL